jgi:hypothetical protein
MAFGGFSVTFLRNLTYNGQCSLRDISSFTVGGDLIGCLNPSNGQNTLVLSKDAASLILNGTTIFIKGNVVNTATLSATGGNSSTTDGGIGGSITIMGSVKAPYVSNNAYEYSVGYQAVTITASGGSYTGSGSFTGRVGGSIRIYGSIEGLGTLSSIGGSTSGTVTAGAGGAIVVQGPVNGVNSTDINAGYQLTISADGGGTSGSVNTNAGPGGSILLHSAVGLVPGTISAVGGQSTSSGTTAAGGLGGTVKIGNGTNCSINVSGGFGAKTGGNGGTIQLAGMVSVNTVSSPGNGMNITANGGGTFNSAVNSRLGGNGGTVNLYRVAGLVSSINASGGTTTSGTGTGQVGGNGGTVNVSGTLQISSVILNGGSSLVTASSFAGSPGSITTSGYITIADLRMRTTGQAGITGTAPASMASGKGQLKLDGYLNVQTLDNTSITGAKIQPSGTATPVTMFVVDTLTTKVTFEDHNGNNPSATQATLCKTRIYKYNTSAQAWFAVTSTAI